MEEVRLPRFEAYEAHMVRKDGEVRAVQIKARSLDFNGSAGQGRDHHGRDRAGQRQEAIEELVRRRKRKGSG